MRSRFAKMSVYERSLLQEGFAWIAGVDEAGRGPLAGPVFAAACILPKGLVLPSLNDSKQLSEKQREFLFNKLQGSMFGIGEASVEEIDQINILQATFLAMQRAVKALTKTPDYILVDGNCAPDFGIATKTIVEGDALSVSIAAASVLAKVSRDRRMRELAQKWPEYGFEQHKGYGTEKHLAMLEKWGPCPIHRRSFAPVKASYDSAGGGVTTSSADSATYISRSLADLPDLSLK